MSKKILFSANLDSFFTKFLVPQLKYFKDKGYIVHVATKLEGIDIPYCDKKINVDFARGFNLKQNINSYKQMKKLFKEEHYDIISCHTPFGGAITRLAFNKTKVKDTKVVYMAHGFHFYKGQQKIKYFIYYFAEKYFAKYTDDLITINLEDYEIAHKKFNTNVHYVPGVGLDENKFSTVINEKEKIELKKSLGINEKDFVMIYSAELTKRKRQLWLIKTLKKMLRENKTFHLLLPGKDSLNGKCQKLVKKYKLENQIHFLGFRNDIPKLLNISDLALSSSKQEGLPVNIMEAIYCGLPIVATDCRGNRDLVKDGKNGYVLDANDSIGFNKKILYFYKKNSKDLDYIKKYDNKVIQDFLLQNVLDDIVKIYEGDM